MYLLANFRKSLSNKQFSTVTVAVEFTALYSANKLTQPKGFSVFALNL